MDVISRLFGTGRSISFPAGKPPIGSCEFASKICLEECANRIRPFKSEINTYRLFRELSSKDIIKKLNAEILRHSSCRVLSWFCESGDCPVDLTAKVVEVMKNLDVNQNGFTRNQALWVFANAIPNVRLALTVENESLGLELSKKGLVSVPNYQEERVKILRSEEIWLCGGGTVCGCGTVEQEESESEEDCGLCHSLSRGCFAA